MVFSRFSTKNRQKVLKWTPAFDKDLAKKRDFYEKRIKTGVFGAIENPLFLGFFQKGQKTLLERHGTNSEGSILARKSLAFASCFDPPMENALRKNGKNALTRTPKSGNRPIRAP